MEPWRDPNYGTPQQRIKCCKCGRVGCVDKHWGSWCFECNVERIERINKQFKDIINGQDRT